MADIIEEAVEIAKEEKAEPKPKRKVEIVDVVEDTQQTLKLADIVADNNIRSELTDISDLATSISSVGVIEPLIVTPQADEAGKLTGKYALVAGYRRFAGAKQAGLKEVPVCIRDYTPDKQLAIAFIENSQRVDMNPMDKATCIAKMLEQGGDQKTLAKLIGVSEGFISQHMALRKLPKQVQNAIKNKKVDLAQARMLGKLKDDEETMIELVKDIPNMTTVELSNKIDHLVEKRKAKEAAEAEKAAKAEKAEKKKSKKADGDDSPDDETDDETPEPPAKKSLAEKYADTELEPLNKTGLREQLTFYANKLERSESEAKRMEYKFVLKGLEIAAGVK